MRDVSWALGVTGLMTLCDTPDTSTGTDGFGPTSIFSDLFANSALWTSLHHAESSPIADVESFGFNQPVVRRSAWSLLQSLLKHRKRESLS